MRISQKDITGFLFMILETPKSKSKIFYYLQDPLFKSSLFIMLTYISSAGFGFVFWMLAAKLYSKEDVGIVTVIISSMSLIILLSRFGLDVSIIRFFPVSDKSKIFNTSAIVTTIFSVMLGAIFIKDIDLFSPSLHFLKSPFNSLLCLLYLIGSSLTMLIDISFVAIRKTAFQFLQSMVIGSRVLLLFPFIALGSIGMFSAVVVSFLLALVCALFILTRNGIRLKFTVDKVFLKESFSYSMENYIVGLLMASPNMILPIIVLNVLGPEKAAYYYIVFAITSLLFMIPTAISTSLFVEGSHGKNLRSIAMKSLFATFSLLVPIIIFIFCFGECFLGIAGKDYASESFDLLKVMTISSIFVAIFYIYVSIKRVQKDISVLILLSGFVFTLLIGLGYFFMLRFGLIGIGYAWITSYIICILMIGIKIFKEGWI